MNLKYLFTVEYTDGTTFKQNKEDLSSIDSTRSAFYDVVNSGKEVKTFTLTRFLEKWSVNLETGDFSHNGSVFQSEENPTLGKRELVFFRQHQHDTVEGVETAHRIIYFIGWKKGKKKQIIGIK